MAARWCSSLVVYAALAGCMPGATGTGGDVDDAGSLADGGAPPVPALALVDVNPASPTFEQPVSPRDYLEQVSGWYFGHAT